MAVKRRLGRSMECENSGIQNSAEQEEPEGTRAGLSGRTDRMKELKGLRQ